MVKQFVGGLLVGVLVGVATGLAQEGAPLPPGDADVVAMESALGQVAEFFKGFILEMKGSLTMLDERVSSLERTSLILKLGLEELGAQFRGRFDELTGQLAKFEGVVGPAIMALEARVTAIEKYDYPSLERRIAALDKACEALGVRIDNNRSKIEGMEVALAGIRTAIEDLPTVVDEVRADITVLREDLEAAKAGCATDHQAMWTAIFLVPIAVGGVLFLLLSSR